MKVPIINHEVTDLTMVQTEKSSVAQVYEQIVSDLKLAIGNLPVSNANGRAHYYAAKALLGKVYLQMAGEPLEDSKAAALAEVELNEVNLNGIKAADEIPAACDVCTPWFAGRGG